MQALCHFTVIVQYLLSRSTRSRQDLRRGIPFAKNSRHRAVLLLHAALPKPPQHGDNTDCQHRRSNPSIIHIAVKSCSTVVADLTASVHSTAPPAPVSTNFSCLRHLVQQNSSLQHGKTPQWDGNETSMSLCMYSPTLPCWRCHVPAHHLPSAGGGGIGASSVALWSVLSITCNGKYLAQSQAKHSTLLLTANQGSSIAANIAAHSRECMAKDKPRSLALMQTVTAVACCAAVESCGGWSAGGICFRVLQSLLSLPLLCLHGRTDAALLASR